ncbi:hypothetical protein T492DRAFT_864675 [Pavlovales sp. CCMP2436]|nr:hypothetical protein T492DRAFT_864675 [Pavlovales sp. CCMP2436]
MVFRARARAAFAAELGRRLRQVPPPGRAARARALGTAAAAPPVTDAQIDELNREIAELFGETEPPNPYSQSHHASTARVDSASSPNAPVQEIVVAARDVIHGAVTKAAADATISQLTERVTFLERLVQQLVAAGAVAGRKSDQQEPSTRSPPARADG